MKSCLFFGISTIDLIYELTANPDLNTKVKSEEFLLLSGGQALNASITNSVLGGISKLISFIGSNNLAKIIHTELNKFSIDFLDLNPQSQELPPISSIFISKQEYTRTIITSKIKKYSTVNIPNINEIIKKNDIIYIDGYYIDVCISIAKIAKKYNKIVVFDGGSWKNGFDKLLKYIDIIICSDNFFPPNTNNQVDVINYLKKVVRTKIYTNGNERIIIDDELGLRQVDVDQVNVVDTLGAGDIFQGALCFYLSNNYNIDNAVLEASKIASNSCKYLGTRKWIDYIK